MEKNKLHGPCTLTGKEVFGSNHFKDLTQEEFKAKYLTGYKGPKTDKLSQNKRRQLRTSDELFEEHVKSFDIISSNGLHDPSVLSHKISRHASVQQRYLEHIQDTPKFSFSFYKKQEKANEQVCECLNYNNIHRGLSFFNAKKQRLCGSSYGKTYYIKDDVSNYSDSAHIDCSKYKLQADSEYVAVSNKIGYSNSCSWYDMTCHLQNVFAPIYNSLGSKESRYSKNYNYPSCKSRFKIT